MEDSLSKKQFGLKKGTSTETALHKVIHKIEKRIAKKGYVLGTFLDIVGAFDNVSFKAISEAIDQSPLDSATECWIKNMVTNRHVTRTHNNATKYSLIVLVYYSSTYKAVCIVIYKAGLLIFNVNLTTEYLWVR